MVAPRPTAEKRPPALKVHSVFPALIRWPGVIKPGTVISEFFAHEDFLPTFAAAAGEPDIVAKVAKGYNAGNKTFKVHLDGYNLIPYFKGKKRNHREGIFSIGVTTVTPSLCGSPSGKSLC